MAVNGTNVTRLLGGLSGDPSYQSPAPVTATGAPQVIAHGLDFTPNRVIVEVLSGHNGMGAAGTQYPAVVKGAPTATDVTVTVTAGATFQLYCY